MQALRQSKEYYPCHSFWVGCVKGEYIRYRITSMAYVYKSINKSFSEYICTCNAYF